MNAISRRKALWLTTPCEAVPANRHPCWPAPIKFTHVSLFPAGLPHVDHRPYGTTRQVCPCEADLSLAAYARPPQQPSICPPMQDGSSLSAYAELLFRCRETAFLSALGQRAPPFIPPCSLYASAPLFPQAGDYLFRTGFPLHLRCNGVTHAPQPHCVYVAIQRKICNRHLLGYLHETEILHIKQARIRNMAAEKAGRQGIRRANPS